MTENAKIVEAALIDTERAGMPELFEHMYVNGFFSAPCSSSHHLAEEGGLAQHSINVMQIAQNLNVALGKPCQEDSVIICALLHDLGKMGQFGKPFYVENRLKSGKLSEAKPYSGNSELIYEEHEIRSVIIASQYIYLSEEEQNAILHHNALWGKLDSAFSSSFDKHPLSLIIHYADLWCSRIIEEGDN